MDRQPFRNQVPRFKLLLARLSLLWEGLWPALLPATLLLGIFLTIAFLDLLPLLPPWLHALVLLFFLLAFAGLLHRGLQGLELPDRAAAQRRLERDSGLAHRPLGSLEDEPVRARAGSDDATLRAYWELHRRRLREQLQQLRVKRPDAGWSRIDRHGLRALVGLPLIIALVVAGGDREERLLRAAVPGTLAMEQLPPPKLDAWISPPDYTGEPPLYLDTDKEGRLRVPSGSRLLAQVQGGHGEPELELSGTAMSPFTLGGENLYRAETSLEEGGRLSVRQRGETLGSWNLEVLPDLPPEAEYLAAPARTLRGALQFDYAVRDDYGVESLVAIIARRDAAGEGESMELPLPLPSRQPKEAEGRSFQDLSPHPWAGIEVSITLEARDAAGQSGRSETIETLLPARIFNHPVAQRLTELRRDLTLDPEARQPVAQELDRLAQHPLHYYNDIVVSLGLLSAGQRLLHDRRDEAVAGVQSLLWDLALRIEDGERAVVERQLRELQQQLQEALASDAPQEEIERLMNELQERLEEYLQSMMEEALENFEEPPAFPFDPNMLSQQDLQQLLEQARDLARSGAREEAQQLLSELQRMLENLQANPQQAQDMSDRLQQSREMMQGLQDLMQRQQQLLDRSFQRNQRGEMPGAADGEEGQEEEGDPGRAPGTAQGDAAEQESLRRALGEMMRRAAEMSGGIPPPLGQSEQAMRAAREALERGSSGEALGPQGEALDHLQQGMEALLEDLAQQFGQGQDGEGPGVGAIGEGNRDPLGRQRGRGGNLQTGDEVQLPDASLQQRAREILNELRRRSGERHRPEIELDYFERLLRQF
ncbi:MAG TPA: TIGR02302 family protein [Kiloniellales bacterium]|nr:TIGR02302 family protein [Kiloniellales bacterium]